MDPISALHAAILHTVRKIPSTDDDENDEYDDDNSCTSSVSFNDNRPIPSDTHPIPSIFAGALSRPPTISTPNISIAASVASSSLPPVAPVSRRDSLEVRYQVVDETKNQLTQFNHTLLQQLAELKQENDRLQRQMAVQYKEHRFAKAQCNDRLLDLQVELDATKLEHLRLKEAKEAEILKRELENLRDQLKDDDKDDDDDDGSSSSHAADSGEDKDNESKQQSPADTTQSQDFATIPTRSLLLPDAESNNTKTTANQISMLQQTIQTLTSEQSIWQQEKQEWELEKTKLNTLMESMTDQVEDGRIRVQWLERELMAICPIDNDDWDTEEKKTDDSKVKEPQDDNNVDTGGSSNGSTASTKKTGRPAETKRQVSQGSTESSKVSFQRRSGILRSDDDDPLERILERRLQDALDCYVRIQGHQNRKIHKLTKQLQLLEKEKKMDEGLQYQQMAEMKQQISYYQHELQQTRKNLQRQVHSRDEFHHEWTCRMERLELENLDLKQQVTKWEQQCLHQTGLLKREVSSLQEKLNTSIKRIQELEQEKEESIRIVAKQMSREEMWKKSGLDAITLQLEQSKEREAMLEKLLLEKEKELKTKEEEMDRCQERIEVLMVYAGMETPNDGDGGTGGLR